MTFSTECSMQNCQAFESCRWGCCVGSSSQNNHKLIHTQLRRTQAKNHDLTSEHNTRSVFAHINTEHWATGTQHSENNKWHKQTYCWDHKIYMHECFHIVHKVRFLALAHSLSVFFLSPLYSSFLLCFHVSGGDMTSSFRPFPKVSQFRFYHSPSVSQPTSQSVIPH